MAALESLKSLTAKAPSIWADMSLVPWENIAIALASVSKEASMYGRLKQTAIKRELAQGVNLK